MTRKCRLTQHVWCSAPSVTAAGDARCTLGKQQGTLELQFTLSPSIALHEGCERTEQDFKDSSFNSTGTGWKIF